MKAQVFTAPSEIGLVIIGAIFIWIGVTILGVSTTSHLVGGFDLYLGGGFLFAGVASIIGGILGLVLH